MLGVKSYPQEYIQACRARLDADLAAYRGALASARSANGTAPSDAALASFETSYFNTQVLALDSFFMHRLRTVEGKNGNPLNEVRVLVGSMLSNGNVFTADSTIKMNPQTSVLGYRYGDEIRLTEESFGRLADAYFAEITAKFS